MKNFLEHARTAGSEFLQDRVATITKIHDSHFQITTISGKMIESKKLLLATGNIYKMLCVPGEKEFYGQGVSYCATCDGNFYKGLVVGVSGGGNTAITEALYLAELCKEVHIFIRGDKARAEDIWIDKARQHTNIIFHMNSSVTSIN